MQLVPGQCDRCRNSVVGVGRVQECEALQSAEE